VLMGQFLINSYAVSQVDVISSQFLLYVMILLFC